MFQSIVEFKLQQIFTGQFLFGSFFLTEINPDYKITRLPGGKRGISGSAVVAYSIAINKNSSNDKRKAVIEAFQYLTSKNMQRDYIKSKKITSCIPSLYDEEEICSLVDCELYKSLQPFGRDLSLIDDYDTFSINFRKNIYNFLYGNETAKDALQKVEDLYKMYYVSIMDDDGFIITIVIMALISIIFLSLVLMFIRKFSPYFNFLPYDFWILINLGIIVTILAGFSLFGRRTLTKCNLNFLLLFSGMTLKLVPMLYKLITNFPNENKISEWITYHKYLFLLIFMIFDLLLLFLFIFPSYDINKKYIKEGKNFEVCTIKSELAYFLIIINFFIKFLIVGSILILIYIEWNIKSSYYDLRVILPAIYTDSLCLVLLLIVKYIVISNYFAYFMVNESIYFFSSLINYILLFGVRIFSGLMNKENDESMFIKSVNKDFLKSDGSLNTRKSKGMNTTVLRQEEFNKFERSATVNSNNNSIKQNNNSISQIQSNNTNINSKRSSANKRNSSILPNVLLTIYGYHNTMSPDPNELSNEDYSSSCDDDTQSN